MRFLRDAGWNSNLINLAVSNTAPNLKKNSQVSRSRGIKSSKLLGFLSPGFSTQ